MKLSFSEWAKNKIRKALSGPAELAGKINPPPSEWLGLDAVMTEGGNWLVEYKLESGKVICGRGTSPSLAAKDFDEKWAIEFAD